MELESQAGLRSLADRFERVQSYSKGPFAGLECMKDAAPDRQAALDAGNSQKFAQ